MTPFVDVPGRQRLVLNMLAGAGPARGTFAIPVAEELARHRLSQQHLGAAVTAGLLCRVADDVCLLPDTPVKAVRRLMGIE
ncbi:hypothetical protein [Micromonospora fluostatini]|uniref:hypothetical protein n=1 Tax=Micromonospora sp. JCM 30529 TaxID=3421643 RepID=UPI003D1857C2